MARAIDVDRVKREIRKNKEKIVISCKQKYVPLSLIYEILNKAPTLTPPNEPERAGLYGKYSVYKNKDGSQVTDCFVLHPDKDPAAVVALTAYATATDNAELAADIRGWIGSEPNEPLTPCDLCRYNPPSSCDGKPCCMCPAEKGSPEGEEDRK